MMSARKSYIFNYHNMLLTQKPVSSHFLMVRCIPYENESLKLVESGFNHYGFEHLNRGVDSYGNTIIYGGTLKPHRTLSWTSSGIVEMSPYRVVNKGSVHIYTLPSKLTTCTDEMIEALNNLNLLGSVTDKVIYLNNFVHNLVCYTQNVTDMKTSAAEVFKLKKGVCQDYAHLLIAFLRALNIPCRYVNGLLLGEGLTHAWVEVLIGDTWYGFDPTHANEIDYGYIKLSHGVDVNSCQVCRGVFTSYSEQTMAVHVSVGEV